jgi:hypothetical protein
MSIMRNRETRIVHGLCGEVSVRRLAHLQRAQLRGLRAVRERREAYSVRNIGDSIAVCVNLELAQRFRREGYRRGLPVLPGSASNGRMHRKSRTTGRTKWELVWFIWVWNLSTGSIAVSSRHLGNPGPTATATIFEEQS